MQKSGRRPPSGKTDVTALTETIGVFDQRKCRDSADWAILMRDIGKGSLHVYIAGNANSTFIVIASIIAASSTFIITPSTIAVNSEFIVIASTFIITPSTNAASPTFIITPSAFAASPTFIITPFPIL
ncbi:hypothetical protein CDAR_561591 [Caerostris darwini]|uniref:Uncharacterized protein n=1 Tax=Caerostris darwini TaxID=1538125 RepID=A0AAV4MIH0_9ARAC|nr:hypothetical protein CDAR_561591 [Caerostris darwini]